MCPPCVSAVDFIGLAYATGHPGARCNTAFVIAGHGPGLKLLAMAETHQEFWKRHPGLVWHNPPASDAERIRAALRRPRFARLLAIALEFGTDRLQAEWPALLKERGPEARRAQEAVARILANTEEGFARAVSFFARQSRRRPETHPRGQPLQSEAAYAKNAPENAIPGVRQKTTAPTGSVLWLVPIPRPRSAPRSGWRGRSTA
jgi:hypothetical protein